MLANVSEKTDSINSSPPTWFNPKGGYMESQNASPNKMVFFLDFFFFFFGCFMQFVGS